VTSTAPLTVPIDASPSQAGFAQVDDGTPINPF
jgi:hypothetical protein